MASIVLIGFMGSGKTTIGEMLASSMQVQWIDLDHYIEEKAKTTIAQLFRTKGETYFRQLEADSLKACIGQDIPIIATGGGIVTTEDNLGWLKDRAHTIYLSYPFDTLYQRIKGDEARPLVTDYEELKARYIGRLPLYEEAASMKIDCEGKISQIIVEEIRNKISKSDVFICE